LTLDQALSPLSGVLPIGGTVNATETKLSYLSVVVIRIPIFNNKPILGIGLCQVIIAYSDSSFKKTIVVRFLPGINTIYCPIFMIYQLIARAYFLCLFFSVHLSSTIIKG
jgi:hypothetical protein